MRPHLQIRTNIDDNYEIHSSPTSSSHSKQVQSFILSAEKDPSTLYLHRSSCVHDYGTAAMHIEECELSDENEEESEEEEIEVDCSMTLQSRLFIEKESASKNYEISPSSILSRGEVVDLGLKDSKRSILHEGSLLVP